jgi:hypothetical protein
MGLLVRSSDAGKESIESSHSNGKASLWWWSAMEWWAVCYPIPDCGSASPPNRFVG